MHFTAATVFQKRRVNHFKAPMMLLLLTFISYCRQKGTRYSVLLYSVVNQQKRISRCAALFQKSHTPVKTQQFKHTSDGTKLIIHNLTKYPFQYSEDTMVTLLILSVAKIFNSFSDWNKVIIYGKIVYMCDQELVCQNKLILVQATFTDVT